MLEMLSSPQFWMDVFKIILIDLLLSGDNAVVIALACRNLNEAQRKKGILLGVVGAVGLRVLLTFFAVGLLALPYLKLIGGILLLWIGIKLILPEDNAHGEERINAEANIWGAVKTIIIADFVMSLDNVLGVAGAAHGNALLLIFGLLVSIPLIAWSSQLVLRLIDRFPIVVLAGGALLGYVAGEMIEVETMFKLVLESSPVAFQLIPIVCAMFVLVAGKLLGRRWVKSGEIVHLATEQISSSGEKQTKLK